MKESLRVRGTVPSEPGIAIVGTRRPTEAAARFAHGLAMTLTKRGFSVWSGGAAGIDTAAHLGALEASGPTVAVLGSGLDRPFPAENARLFERIIAEGGATLSLVPDDARAVSAHFLKRNAYLARHSVALVLVECGLKSGARHAAGCARRLDRPVFAVPCAPWSKHVGTLHEIRRGAAVFLNEEAFLESLRELGIAPDAARSGAKVRSSALPQGYGETEARFLALLGERSLHPDEICNGLGIPPEVVARIGFQLEVDGVVVRTLEGLLALAP